MANHTTTRQTFVGVILWSAAIILPSRKKKASKEISLTERIALPKKREKKTMTTPSSAPLELSRPRHLSRYPIQDINRFQESFDNIIFMSYILGLLSSESFCSNHHAWRSIVRYHESRGFSIVSFTVNNAKLSFAGSEIEVSPFYCEPFSSIVRMTFSISFLIHRWLTMTDAIFIWKFLWYWLILLLLSTTRLTKPYCTTLPLSFFKQFIPSPFPYLSVFVSIMKITVTTSCIWPQAKATKERKKEREHNTTEGQFPFNLLLWLDILEEISRETRKHETPKLQINFTYTFIQLSSSSSSSPSCGTHVRTLFRGFCCSHCVRRHELFLWWSWWRILLSPIKRLTRRCRCCGRRNDSFPFAVMARPPL